MLLLETSFDMEPLFIAFEISENFLRLTAVGLTSSKYLSSFVSVDDLFNPFFTSSTSIVLFALSPVGKRYILTYK